MTRPRAVLLGLLGLGAGILLAGSFVRVPAGQTAATSRGWIGPGVHLRVPFSRAARLPSSGPIEIAPIEAPTPGGGERRLSVRLDYRISNDAPVALARQVARTGLPATLATLLSQALADHFRLAPAARLPRSGSSGDPLGAALAAALRERRIDADGLEWRIVGAPTLPAVVPAAGAPRRKVLLVGLDAADWRIATPLMRQGRLPVLSRLVREGAAAPLRSLDPMISPLIWTTIVTGVGPDVHGVADFLVNDSATGRLVPITSRFRKVKAIWNILSDAGISSGFAGWWASYPAEPVRGVIVSDLLGFAMNRAGGTGPSVGQGITFPDGYLPEIRPRLVVPSGIAFEEAARLLRLSRREFDEAREERPPQKIEPEAPPIVQNPVWHVRKIIAATRNYETIALDLLRKDLDVVGVYFEGIDMMGHRFQHCMSPPLAICPPAEYAASKDAVASFYEYQDEVLGRLMEAAPGRTVIVLSDHGFRSGEDRPADLLPYTTGQPVEWHREQGLLVLSGPGIRPGASLARASVLDIVPTLLALLGLPASEEMTGKALVEALDSVAARLASLPRIASYEETGTGRDLVQAAASPEAQQEMLEALQALGYVGPIPPPSGPPPAGGPSASGLSLPPGTTAQAGEGALAGSPPRAGGAHGGGREKDGDPAAPAGETTRVIYHRNLATYFLKAGRMDEAEAQLRKANQMQPLPKTYELLSEIHAAKGDIDAAVKDLEDGLEAFREMDEDAVLWIVDLRIGTGRADLAEQSLARSRPRLRRPAVIAACEGKLAAARGEQELAISLYLDALRSEPALSQAALAAAPLLSGRGRLAELEAPLTRALSVEPRLDEYQNLIGLIRLGQGRRAEALAALGRALDLRPANARFLENFAAAAIAAGAPRLAIDRYRMGLEEPGAAPAAWAGFGRLLGQAREPAEAVSAFEKAVSLGERNAATYAGLATALLQSGQTDRSREVVREGLGAFPDDPSLRALDQALRSRS